MTTFKQLGIQLKKGKNQQKTKCPKCGGKNSLSVNVGLRLFKCHSCKWSGKATSK